MPVSHPDSRVQEEHSAVALAGHRPHQLQLQARVGLLQVWRRSQTWVWPERKLSGSWTHQTEMCKHTGSLSRFEYMLKQTCINLQRYGSQPDVLSGTWE